MRYIATIIVLIVIMAVEYKKHKTVLCATVIYPVMWILSLLGLIISPDYYTVSLWTLLIIVIGYVLFCAAFNYANRGYIEKNVFNAEYVDNNISDLGMTISFYLSVIVGAFYLLRVRNYISLSSLANTLSMIRRGKASGSLSIPIYLTYVSGMVQCAMWMFLLLYLRNTEKGYSKNNVKQHALRVRFIILFVLSIVSLLTNFSRNSLLYYGLSVFFVVAISRRYSNKKVTVIGAVGLFLFLLFFVWFSNFRDAYLYAGNNFIETATGSLRKYLCGSIIAFDQCLRNGTLKIISFDGLTHTFSAIMSIIDRVFYTSFTPDVVLQSIKIGPAAGTNVYTVYYWTALDLGVVYSVICQMFYGFIHGYLYKGVRCGSFRKTYWYSIFVYPLVMMFFEEQYFSIGQSWLQRLFAYLVVATLCGVSMFKMWKRRA